MAQEQQKSQEELAKEWEEALKARQEASEGNQPEGSPEEIAKAWQEALKEQEKDGLSEDSSPTQLNADSEFSCQGKFELLKDIPLEVTVEIGSTKLPLEEILNQHANSVVELDRFVDEPVDIKINGRLVAKGKLYVVKDSYGVEIVQIVTPKERLKLIEE